MRVKRFLQNMAVGVGGQMFTYILQFISRTVFIYTLGKEYLGISGLFSNIIGVLSVTELGLGAAVTFSLYAPLANDDKKRIFNHADAAAGIFPDWCFYFGCWHYTDSFFAIFNEENNRPGKYSVYIHALRNRNGIVLLVLFL